MTIRAVIVLLSFLVLVESISFMDPKVLVVVDDDTIYQSHSVLFSTLEGSVMILRWLSKTEAGFVNRKRLSTECEKDSGFQSFVDLR